MNFIAVRASSLAELFDCAARWEAKHLLGMRLPSSGAATLGTAIHAGTAAFDQAALDLEPISVDDAAGVLVDAIWKPKEDVDWGDDKPKDAEKIGLSLLGRYCAQVAPKYEFSGVEVTCERLEIEDLGLILTGTTDRIRKVGNKHGIVDLKSGGRAVGTDGRAAVAGHGPQMGVYELLAEVSLGQAMDLPAQVIGLQTGKTANAQRIGTGEIVSPRKVLIGSEDDPGLLQHAAKMIHGGIFPGNPKSSLCSGKYCPRYSTCKYR